MEEPRDIQGLEFDWFAMDLDGCVALFATAGRGPIPSSVFEAIDAHIAIGEYLPVSGLGSIAVWQSYAVAGLYAFDWSESLDRYIRVAEPIAGAAFKHTQVVAAIPGLPRWLLSFARAEVVRPTWQDSA